MNRLLAALTVLALAVGAPAALAHKSGKRHTHKKPTPRAKVYKATLGPVTTDAVYAGIRGRAQLVDGKKNNKISIHVRNLQPGVTYPWHIHEFAAGVTNPCLQGAAQGPIVTAFRYGTLTANASGNANATGRSRTFNVDKTKRYYVNVHAPTGEPIACGVLKRKKAHRHASKGRGDSRGDRRGSGGKGKRRP